MSVGGVKVIVRSELTTAVPCGTLAMVRITGGALKPLSFASTSTVTGVFSAVVAVSTVQVTGSLTMTCRKAFAVASLASVIWYSMTCSLFGGMSGGTTGAGV